MFVVDVVENTVNRRTVGIAALVVIGIGICMAAGLGAAVADARRSGRDLPNCPSGIFANEAMVFGALAICATSEVSLHKLSHAANVAAEWLDNDGDGTADEPRVIEAMQTTRPFVLMTPTESTIVHVAVLIGALRSRANQDLNAAETNPGGGERDASQEEILHTLQNGGWAIAFPDAFLDQPGSTLYSEWQTAEAQGHYVYDDVTCSAACKVTEFTYAAVAAYLGSAPDLASNEILLQSRQALRKGLPGTVAVFESSDYAFPRNHWPTGHYSHQENIVDAPPNAIE